MAALRAGGSCAGIVCIEPTGGFFRDRSFVEALRRFRVNAASLPMADH
jgi:hypothetical protein